MHMQIRQPFRFQTRIRFVDTDASGRIHYTAMFRHFEAAETEFMRSLEVRYSRDEYLFPRVHVECDFRVAIQYDDLIDIEVFLTKLGKSSVRFKFRTWKTGDLAASGAVVAVCVDAKTQRSMPIPEELRNKLLPAVEETV